MKIYAVQLDIAWEDKPTNFDRVACLLAEAQPETGSLIVLPEMFATGFSMDLSKTLEPEMGDTPAFLRRIAIQYSSCVIGGMVAVTDRGKAGNVALAIGPDGNVLARYAKMQPFTVADEHRVHEAGDRVVTLQFGGFTIAPFVCYDLRFPELARKAIDVGADFLIYIASWPEKRECHWVTLLQARAIENLAYVVGVNRCGTDPHVRYPGRSLIIDPQGGIVADAGDQQSVLAVSCSPSVVREWRDTFPALRDRKRQAA